MNQIRRARRGLPARATESLSSDGAGVSTSAPASSPIKGQLLDAHRGHSQTAFDSAGASASAHPIPPIEGHSPVALKGHRPHAFDATAASAAVAPLIDPLRALQQRRRFLIRTKNAAARQSEAYIAAMLGYHTGLAEPERKAILARATKAIACLTKTNDAGRPAVVPLMFHSLVAMRPFLVKQAEMVATTEATLKQTVKAMEVIAVQLPAYAFVRSVKGFGAQSYAIIIGATGPLWNYATHSKVWKRLGLAVFGGRRQRRIKGDGAIAMGYDAVIRSEVYVMALSLFKAQWRADADGEGHAGPIGPYGAVYGNARRAAEPRIAATADLPANHPDKWTKARVHNHAMRLMSKKLIRDLWKAWRHAAPPCDV